MIVRARPLSSQTGPTGPNATAGSLTRSQPGHDQTVQVPSCMFPGPGGSLGPTGTMGLVGQSSALGVTPEDATSLDSFWWWIKDQGCVCPSGDPGNPLA